MTCELVDWCTLMSPTWLDTIASIVNAAAALAGAGALVIGAFVAKRVQKQQVRDRQRRAIIRARAAMSAGIAAWTPIEALNAQLANPERRMYVGIIWLWFERAIEEIERMHLSEDDLAALPLQVVGPVVSALDVARTSASRVRSNIDNTRMFYTKEQQVPDDLREAEAVWSRYIKIVHDTADGVARQLDQI